MQGDIGDPARRMVGHACMVAVLLREPAAEPMQPPRHERRSESATDSQRRRRTRWPTSSACRSRTTSTSTLAPSKRSVWILNIQPVIPIKLTDDWNLITRTIVPIINQPPLAPGVDQATGMGDINPSVFLSPSGSKEFIWGIGPTFTFPSATNRLLGMRQVERRARGRGPHDAGPLGGRRARQQPVVVRRLGTHPGERAAPAAVRELQLRRGLVPGERAHPDGRTGWRAAATSGPCRWAPVEASCSG